MYLSDLKGYWRKPVISWRFALLLPFHLNIHVRFNGPALSQSHHLERSLLSISIAIISNFIFTLKGARLFLKRKYAKICILFSLLLIIFYSCSCFIVENWQLGIVGFFFFKFFHAYFNFFLKTPLYDLRPHTRCSLLFRHSLVRPSLVTRFLLLLRPITTSSSPASGFPGRVAPGWLSRPILN